MIKRLVLFLAIFASTLSNAATYYVSPSGNDSNNGTTITTPWKTIGKVNTRQLVAGDQILFERGGTFRGTLNINYSGTDGNPILVSAYGSGINPTLLGSQLTSNWVLHQGNIWKTQINATQVVHLFFNDSLMTIAKYPNNGWLRNTQGTNSQITDNQLTQPTNYWNGSTLVIRSSSWSYDTSRVLSYSPGVINFRPISYDLGNSTWGYFIRNKFQELDAPGEWFFDKTTSTLYFYPPTGNPNLNNIEIITTFQEFDATGVRISWQRSNVVIENLNFSKYSYAGVSTSGSLNITVRNCNFTQCDYGMRLYGNNQIIRNNTITKCYQMGINSISGGSPISYGNNNTFEDNIIQNCALYPGLGKSEWGYFGLSVTGSNNIIKRNYIDNIGYIGLSFDSNTVVENNFVKNSCSILNDGSGIAFDRTNGAIIRNNIVLSTIGNVESCATNTTNCDPKGKGIYFGNISNKNILVEGNTVAYCNGAGIWFDHTMVSEGNQIINNTLFGNNLYQFGVSDFSNYNGPGATSPYSVSQYNNQIVSGNIFYSNNQQQKTMYHINRWFSGVNFANFNENKYINPWDTINIQVFNIAGGNNLNYSLSQWKNIRNDDSVSTNQPYLPQSTSSDHILVYNNQLNQQSISVPNGTWSDLNGNLYTSSVNVPSFESKVLFKSSLPPAPVPPTTPSTNSSLIVQASVNGTSPSITISWISYASATGYSVFRKLKNATSWGNAIATLGGSATQYVDNNVVLNTYYEYRVVRNASVGTAYGYVATGIQLNAVDYRGKLVLVVDNTFTTSLSTQITQLQNDLKLDGWNVVRIDVSKTATPASVKSQIQTTYNADPTNVKSVLLLGHVPVYRSGNIAPDGHSSIPWACDSYYGDMNGTWASPPTSLPSDLELQVGRIDLFNLPAFGQSEQQLLSNYLNKLHQFKIKQFTPQNRILIQDNLNFVSNPLAETAYRTAGPLVGEANITTIPAYNQPNFISRMSEGWLWGYFSGGGSYNSADGIGNTTSFTTTQNNVVFNMSLGSYFGNWDASTSVPNWNNNTDNLLRAALVNGQALTNVWAGLPNWFFHHMGMGDPIGYSTSLSINNRTSNALYQLQNGGWQGQGLTTVHLGLMGDPSLRMNYVAPPTNLTITNNGTSLTFNWTASSEAVDGYNLYEIVSGVPTRINQNLITSTTFTGNFNLTVGTEYMVRAVKLINNFSGSYFNLSLGTNNTVQQSATPTLLVKVFLGGAYDNGLMYDSLRVKGLLPLSDPYPGLGYTHVLGGGQTTTQSVLSIAGNSAIVDWVVIELRNITTPTTRVFTRSALLQRDGDIVDMDGISPISLQVASGQYYIAVKHRNHLGVMTALPISLQNNTTINFTTEQTYGTDAQKTIGSIKVMWDGNTNFDNTVKYAGQNNDRDPILSRIGGVIPTNIVMGYYLEDVNMDGFVKYTGQNNDRDNVLFNIGGTVPTNIKTQQIP
jgi:hypothetical protein